MTDIWQILHIYECGVQAALDNATGWRESLAAPERVRIREEQGLGDLRVNMLNRWWNKGFSRGVQIRKYLELVEDIHDARD